MNLPVTLHQARLGPVGFTVVRPARPLERAVLLDRDRYLDACLDQEAAERIGALWLLAARSPRALVHLPIRGNGVVGEDGARPLDLVLLHHSLQFAPSRWKELRGRLGPGRPRTLSLPQPPEPAAVDHAARHHRENRDLFHQHLHAETLFLTGSAKLFRETAHHFPDLARRGPGRAPAGSGHPHVCAELHSNDGVLGNAREMHFAYCPDWEWAGPAERRGRTGGPATGPPPAAGGPDQPRQSGARPLSASARSKAPAPAGAVSAGP
ncbi:hypothetical protein ACFW1A_14605 [Kitasatospora sp. NPDC058965]|uniref:hypothetical protein n=1 Tax=Kitasatospora sp. NPDC058965 TaxID=3346682 RepID=UPI0036865A7F